MSDVPEREQIVVRLRPHARALFWPSALLVVVAAAFGYFGGRFAEPWLNIAVAVAAGLLVLVGCLLPLLGWLARNYTITTRRIVLRSGIAVRLRQEVLHTRIRSVTVTRGWLQTLWGTGDVLLDVGSDRQVVLRDLSLPMLIQDAIHDLM